MKKSVLYLGLFIAVSCLFFSGCGNSNIFSWAHDSGSGDYSSLMSDANAAMKDSNYSKAAKYYESALKKNPSSSDAALGYSSAKFADVVSSQYADIINAIINVETGSTDGLLDFLTGDTPKKLKDALKDVVGNADTQNGYLTNIASNDPNASTDVLINAAAASILLGVAEILTSSSDYIKNNIVITKDFGIIVRNEPVGDELQAFSDATGLLLKRAANAISYLQRAPLDPANSKVLDEIITYFNRLESEVERIRAERGLI